MTKGSTANDAIKPKVNFSSDESVEMITDEWTLVSHSVTDEPFSCKECGEMFKTKEIRTVHELTHSGEVEELLALNTPKKFCRECGIKFPETEFKKHKMAHTGAISKTIRPVIQTEVRSFKCKTCDKTFRNLLQDHTCRVSTTLFWCAKCDQEFQKKDDLKKHEKNPH